MFRSADIQRLQYPIPKTLRMASRRGSFEITAEMVDVAEAKTTESLVQRLLANARAAMTTPEQAPYAALLGMYRVTAEGPRVTLSLTDSGTETANLGVLAAIAIPSLLRARISANEAATIGDIRTVISAEAAYQAVGHGYADMPCLANAASCVKGYVGTAFLSKDLAEAKRKSGYDRTFHPGLAGQLPGTYRKFAYTATPVEPGKSGVRSFCGDSTGRVCFEPTGCAIVPTDGACPATCTFLTQD
jgi:type II secretory pathway pseudopilin PulG